MRRAWLWLIPAVSFALDPSVRLSQYAQKHWQVEQGLPQNYVTALAETKDGYLLVGTSGGVARFDGVRFTPIVLDEKTGITREWITALHVQPDGQITIASRDDGLFASRDGRVVRISPVRLDALTGSSGGGIYGLGAGLWRSTGGKWTQIRADFSPADLNWQGLTVLPDGLLLAATPRGLYSVDTRGRVGMPVAGDARRGMPLSFAKGRDGRLWVGTTKGLFQVRGGDLAGDWLPQKDVAGPVVSIVEDRDGVTWAATWGRGLFRVTQQETATWTAKDGLPDDFVHVVYEDREGSLWVGTRGGLSRWTRGPITPYGPSEGLNGQFFSAITGTAAGEVWFGSWRSGLYRWMSGVARRQPMHQPDLLVLVRALLAVPDGSLWASDWQGLNHYSPAGVRRRYTAADLGHAAVSTALALDPDGRFWIGTADGLYQHRDQRIPADLKTRLPGHAVQTLLPAKSGVWAGTNRGLWLVESGSERSMPGLPHPSVTSLFADRKGRLWVTTRANGFSVMSADGTIRSFDQRHGLPALPFFAAVDDRRNSVWLSSPAGIYELGWSQVEQLLEGQRSTIEAVRYTQDDGLRTIECQLTGQPTGWLDPGGSVWFPTVRGAVRIQADRRNGLPPPTVLVESIHSRGGEHTIHYTATRLSAPHRLEFRYRLDSAQNGWTLAGNERVLRPSGLPAGQHRLWIAARESGGEWGEPTAVLLQQAPRWFETWAFRLAAGLGAAGLLLLIYRWRMYLLRGRYTAVLAERNRIAREWHDTLLAGLSAISWQLDAARQRVLEKSDRAADTIETARKMVSHYRTEARRVIWDLRREEPEPESLAAAVEHAIAELVRDRGIASKVEVAGKPFALPGDLSQNLLRICQEAVCNAMQHGSPSKILVRLTYGNASVEVRVEDDGAGFDPALVEAGHFGLDIMRERATRFGGQFAITSQPREGTVVCASIPYSGNAA